MADTDWRDFVETFGPYGVLVGIVAFMLWIRTRPADAVVRDGAVYFSGNDPWYHNRMVHLVVDHFPATVRFDPWSRFPYGTGRHSGFGGLFDQLIALAAMVVGVGEPSAHLVDVTTAYAPVVFGAGTAVVVYVLVKRIVGTWTGLLAAGLLALLGGQFLSRTVVGSADHQSAEAFFGALAVLGFLYAVQVVYTEKPLIVDLRDRNWIVLRRPVVASVLGGVAMAAYLLLWPPGVMLGFTLGIFVILQSIRDHLTNRPLEYLAFASVIAFGVTGGITLLYAKSFELNPTAFSLLQPIVFLGIAAGAVVLYLISSVLDERREPPERFPIVVVLVLGAALGLMAVAFPRGIGLLQNLIERIYSFGLLTSPSTLTVAEIQPADLEAAWRAFSMLFYVAVVGAVILLVRVVRNDRPGELLVLLWSLTMFSAYFTSIRFGYYVAVNVAVLAAVAIWWTTHHLLHLDPAIRTVDDVQAYQIIGVIVILVAVVPGNVVAIDGRQPVWETAERYGGANMAWQDELRWVDDNTPEVPLEYTARFAPPEDGDFEYPPGAYGVMSWWDYGHWITVTGHRIPFANPFQQGPVEASAYLQAQNETRANLMLEALPSTEQDERVARLSNAELRSVIAGQTEQEAGEDIRYVMIDDQMMGGKFGAIATWIGPGYGAYVSTQEFRLEGLGQTAPLQGVNRRYHDTMMARLYFGDTARLAHYRLVHESRQTSTFVSVAQQTRQGWRSTSLLNRRLSSQIFSVVQQRRDLAFYDVRQASRVKTFERVAGARITGTVETRNETTVYATLPLRTNTGRNFTYVQRTESTENGRFSMTVPYATTGAVGPEAGGTDSGVTAHGAYTISVGNPIMPRAEGTVAVSETAIYEGETVSVGLTPVDRGNTSSSGQ